MGSGHAGSVLKTQSRRSPCSEAQRTDTGRREGAMDYGISAGAAPPGAEPSAAGAKHICAYDAEAETAIGAYLLGISADSSPDLKALRSRRDSALAAAMSSRGNALGRN